VRNIHEVLFAIQNVNERKYLLYELILFANLFTSVVHRSGRKVSGVIRISNSAC